MLGMFNISSTSMCRLLALLGRLIKPHASKLAALYCLLLPSDCFVFPSTAFLCLLLP